MGQKVNPIGLRLGYNRGWTANWFSSKQYGEYAREDAAIRALIKKKHPRSGIASVEIDRNRGEVVVTVTTSKPGIVIGRSGSGSQDLKAQLERIVRTHNTAQKQSVRLNIVEMKSPETNARIVAETIAGQIERRIAVKRAMRQAIERAVERRVQGIKVRVSGRLGGAEIARSEKNASGSIPLQTIRSSVDYALAEAHTTYGIVGVKVWIYNGELQNLPVEPQMDRARHQRKR